MAIDFPNSPTVNQSFTAGGLTWTWDGVTWRSVGQPTPGRFLVSETAPSAPSTGDSWFKSSTGQTFVYYDSYWVETSVSPAGPTGAPGTYQVSATAPSAPSAGNAWFNTTDGRMYVWSGTEWFEPVSGLQGANGVYNFGETAPASPAIGQGWVNTNTGKMYIWSGTEWFEPTNNGASANTVSLTGGSTIIPQTPSTIGLTTKAAPGQTADLQQWQNTAGTVVAEVSADGSGLFSNNVVAGKNVLINGGFDIWQRGTSIVTSYAYTADRWLHYNSGSGQTITFSRQSFTPGELTTPSGEAPYYMRIAASVAGSGSTRNIFSQNIEDVRTLAGQVSTLSFWAKADAARTVTAYAGQNTGSGNYLPDFDIRSFVLSTSWTRYTVTFTMPSISGRTLTANSLIEFGLKLPQNSTFTIDLWGIQLEAGSVATPFSRAGGTLQGELAACQRYFFRINSGATANTPAGVGGYYNSTTFLVHYPFKTTMRVAPALTVNNVASWSVFSNGSSRAASAIVIDNVNTDMVALTITTSAATAGQTGQFQTNNANGSLDLSAEL